MFIRIKDIISELKQYFTKKYMDKNVIREHFYKSEGIREEWKKYCSWFDPSNFCIQISDNLRYSFDLPYDTTLANDLIAKGKFDEAKNLVRDKLFLLNEQDRIKTIFLTTSTIHEMRHFHDSIGTTCGFARLLRVISDAIDFDEMWDELRKFSKLKIPLVKWGTDVDSPQVLKDYLIKRESFIDWLNWYDGSGKPIKIEGHTNKLNFPIIYDLEGSSKTLFGTPITLMNFTEGNTFQMIFPIGMQAILEGNAFTIQREVSAMLFGNIYDTLLKQYATLSNEDDYQNLYYMVIDTYLSKVLNKFYRKHQLAISEIALMAEDPFDKELGHPGLRIDKIAFASKNAYHRDGNLEDDLEMYMNNIVDKLGWKRIKDIAQQNLDDTQLKINKIEERKIKNERWWSLLKTIYKTHRDFLKAKTLKIDIFSEPRGYFKLFPILPLPPIIKKGNDIDFYGNYGEDEAMNFMDWFCFEHLQHQLLFSNKLPCPGGTGTHPCPGDPIEQRDWQPDNRCYYSLLLEQLGLPELDISTY